MSADSSEGSANALSRELVWSDCVPPRTAASAWSATRTTLFAGSRAVSVQPAVCVWKRSIIERGFLAPKRSAISRHQTRRAARNFATSSSRLLCAPKKKLSRGAKSSTSKPAAKAASTYATASAKVKAISWAAVAPASRI